MNPQFFTTLSGGLCFAVATVMAAVYLSRPVIGTRIGLVVAAILGIAIDLIYVAFSISGRGLVTTFQTGPDAMLVLAVLIGLMGLLAHLATTLRGVDIALLAVAAIVELSQLAAMPESGVDLTRRPWFVSHSLAFAISGAFFVASGVAGIMYLMVYRSLHRKRPMPLLGKLAPLESLERFSRLTLAVGFPLFTYGILTGFCGVAHRTDLSPAKMLADPSFWLSSVGWIVYAYILYCLLFRPSMRGPRAAVLTTFGFCLVAVTFVAREVVSPLHQ
jgi:ABC-type uncharacterized transport system permease subunit